MNLNTAPFLDYFFDVGLSNVTLLESRISPMDNGRHIPCQELKNPSLLNRYPKEDTSDAPFPEFLTMFCFPNDIRLLNSERESPKEIFHSFVITNHSGSRFFGVCITFHERLETEKGHQLEQEMSNWREIHMNESDLEFGKHIKQQLASSEKKLEILLESSSISDEKNIDSEIQDSILMLQDQISLLSEIIRDIESHLVLSSKDVWSPRCIGFLSRWPWYNLYRDILIKLLIRKRKGILFEDWIDFLLNKTPIPPCGKIEIALPIDDMMFIYSRPKLNHFPKLLNISLYTTFKIISSSHIVLLIEALLIERKIILVSSHLALLNQVAETLISLLFPFYWHHIFVPVLPARLLNYLQAPLPYLIGVDRSYFPLELQKESLASDCIIMDIDQDTFKAKQPPLSLPSREKRKLLGRLKDILGRVSCTNKTPKISNAFYEALPDKQFIPFSNESCRESDRINAMKSQAGIVSDENPSESIIESPVQSPLESPLESKESFQEDSHSRKSSAFLKPANKSYESLFDRIKNHSKSHHSLHLSGWKSDLSIRNESKNDFKAHGHVLTKKTMKQVVESPTIWTPIHNGMRKTSCYKIPSHLCRLCFQTINLDTEYYECQYCTFNIHVECIQWTCIKPCPFVFQECKLRDSFFNLFISILRNYTFFIKKLGPSQDYDHLESLFNLDDFVQDLDLETQVFMSGFSETQSFHEFIRTCHQQQGVELDYETIFLNQSIQAKVNRSKFVFSKSPTKFLDDDSYDTKSTVCLCTAKDASQYKSSIPNPLLTKWDLQLLSTFTKSLMNPSNFKSTTSTSQWLANRLKTMSIQSTVLVEQKKLMTIQTQLKQVSLAISTFGSGYLSIETQSSMQEAISQLKHQHSILKDILLEQSDILQERDEFEIQFLYNQLFIILSIYEDYYEHGLGLKGLETHQLPLKSAHTIDSTIHPIETHTVSS